MKIYLLLTITLIFISCEKIQKPLSDQTSSIFGEIKSEQGILIDSCIVGFLSSNFDSTLNVNDSTIVKNLEMFTLSSQGKYEINWFLGPVPLPFEKMYAFKPGYNLWQYNGARDIIINVETNADSLNIVLIKSIQ